MSDFPSRRHLHSRSGSDAPGDAFRRLSNSAADVPTPLPPMDAQPPAAQFPAAPRLAESSGSQPQYGIQVAYGIPTAVGGPAIAGGFEVAADPEGRSSFEYAADPNGRFVWAFTGSRQQLYRAGGRPAASLMADNGLGGGGGGGGGAPPIRPAAGASAVYDSVTSSYI